MQSRVRQVAHAFRKVKVLQYRINLNRPKGLLALRQHHDTVYRRIPTRAFSVGGDFMYARVPRFSTLPSQSLVGGSLRRLYVSIPIASGLRRAMRTVEQIRSIIGGLHVITDSNGIRLNFQCRQEDTQLLKNSPTPQLYKDTSLSED